MEHGSKPDSSDKLEKRLPAGGQAVTGWGAEDTELGVQQRGGGRGYPQCRGAEAAGGPGASLAGHVALWTRRRGRGAPQTVVLPGQGLKCMGRAGNLWCLSARLENGQLQDGQEGVVVRGGWNAHPGGLPAAGAGNSSV